MTSVTTKSNNKLNKDRHTIYKHKGQFFKHPDLAEIKLEVISKKKQSELSQLIEKENRIQRTTDIVMIALMIATMSSVLIWLL